MDAPRNQNGSGLQPGLGVCVFWSGHSQVRQAKSIRAPEEWIPGPEAPGNRPDRQVGIRLHVEKRAQKARHFGPRYGPSISSEAGMVFVLLQAPGADYVL